MKLPLSLLALFIVSSLYSQSVIPGKIVFKDCFTSYRYEVNTSGRLLMYQPWFDSANKRKVYVDTTLTDKDIVYLSKLLHLFFENESDEVYDNVCVSDGSTHKLFLQTGSKKKKIYLHYFYDERVNNLKKLLRPYLNPRDAIVKFNLISTELLSDQSKQFLLNEFCELNEF
jgi:hypothetical protein